MPSNVKPLVTIGIPTYNRADNYLPNAITSALTQTYHNIEVIVSDNCSTDNTEELVRSISDSRLRYIRPETNIGSNGNFNFCLRAAKGEYFLLLCDDDLIDHDFIETCMCNAHYSTVYGFIRTGTRIIDLNGNVTKEKPNYVTGPSLEDFYLSWFEGKTVLYLCSTLFNTLKLREIGGLHSIHNLFEDGIAVVKLSEKWGRVDIVDVKASFRKSPGQRTHSVPVREWIEEFKVLLDMICTQVLNRKEEVKEKGMRFFSAQSISRVKSVRSPLHRALAYLIAARYFSPRYWP